MASKSGIAVGGGVIDADYYQISKVFGHLGAKTRPKYGLVASWRQGVRILKKLGSTQEKSRSYYGIMGKKIISSKRAAESRNS